MAKYISPPDIEKQEHLSPETLALLRPAYHNDIVDTDRPHAGFRELMEWAESKFSQYLDDHPDIDQPPLHRFVHNRIVIDGQFLQFCQERKITVECLYRDAAISWKSEHDYEKFFVQGVFLIKSKDVEFLHCALFTKGNQYEDEVVFFILCSHKNYEGYINLRNQFDIWILERDRSNLHIRVIGGDDLLYTKDHSWDELFLPTQIKTDLKGLVENFLSSKSFYQQNKIPWKRGVLLYGPAGNGKSSIIRTIISEYDFKPITIAANVEDGEVREAFSYAESQSPSLLYFEDLDSLLERSLNASTFLNLMDGISAQNGMLVIATANEIRKLKPNITRRPSRFDRKFEIPLPSLEMVDIYIRRWFGAMLPNKEIKSLAQSAVKNELSYAYIKELYISSMFEALSHNRKKPTVKEVHQVLNRLVKDKNSVGGNTISTDKYFNPDPESENR